MRIAEQVDIPHEWLEEFEAAARRRLWIIGAQGHVHPLV
jgi:hypothetical protein